MSCFRTPAAKSISGEMNGTAKIGGGSLGNPGPSWHVKGSGDFNGDGFSDVLFQNDSGEVYVWQLDGTSKIGGGSLGNPGADWHALRTGDYNGDAAPTSCSRMQAARSTTG